jgi:hypothetical protein
MPISVFLSTVSDEFRAYRDQLDDDLTRQNVAAKVQEGFKEVGYDTLDKLDTYIANCDAVVHLIGDMCGAAAAEAEQRALLAKYPRLPERFPPLGQALERGVTVTYTQWEAWLALYHGKRLRIAKAHKDAPRGPNYKPTDTSRTAQEAHLARLREAKQYPFEFTSPDDLAKQVLASDILDLLAEDRAAQAGASRQEGKIDEILRRLSQSASVPLDTLRAILASMGEAAESYDGAEIERKLTAKASEFRDLSDRLNRLSNADPVVARLRGRRERTGAWRVRRSGSASRRSRGARSVRPRGYRGARAGETAIRRRQPGATGGRRPSADQCGRLSRSRRPLWRGRPHRRSGRRREGSRIPPLAGGRAFQAWR